MMCIFQVLETTCFFSITPILKRGIACLSSLKSRSAYACVEHKKKKSYRYQKHLSPQQILSHDQLIGSLHEKMSVSHFLIQFIHLVITSLYLVTKPKPKVKSYAHDIFSFLCDFDWTSTHWKNSLTIDVNSH